MDVGDIPLFALADQRLSWVDRRQSLLSQNVANADTPGYAPRDLLPFDQALARSHFDISMTRTSPLDLAGTAPQTSGTTEALTGEQAPDGNAVSLDDQLARIADTDQAQAVTTGLYTAYLNMFRTAIDR